MPYRASIPGDFLHLPDRGSALWAGTVTTDGMEDSDYDATIELAIDTERLQQTVERLEIRRRPGGLPVTAQRLRETGEVGRVIRYARRVLSSVVPAGGEPTLDLSPGFGLGPGFEPDRLGLPTPVLDHHETSIEVGARRHGRAGRAFVADADLRKTASVYRRAKKRGEPTTAAVQQALDVNADVARQRIHAARDAGYLRKLPKGTTRPTADEVL
jgi:hypothetical protein